MRIGVLFLLSFWIYSCSEPEVKSSQKHYADIKGFVESEVSRLSKSNTRVNKTVMQNGISESLTNLEVNWEDELALFSESDINKTAWQDSYSVIKKAENTEFLALDSTLRTRLIITRQNKNKEIVYLQIRNRTKNNLYKTDEVLTYIPDSVYSIIKDQKVIFLGKNRFEIRGSLIR